MGKGNGKFVLGAVLGTIAGAVAGVLLTPKNGKETRKIIKEKAEDCIANGKKTTEDLIKKISEKIEKD